MGQHSDEDGDGRADWAQPGQPAPIEQARAAQVALAYRHREPATDPAWPQITDAPDELPDAFPDNWGAEPTPRDQAAIDAGNA